MRSIILIASIISAFIIDALWGQIARGFLPPLVIITAFFWMVRLSFNQRIIFALILGSILDTIALLPAGTYSLMLLLAAFLCQPMKQFFDNTESRAVMALHALLLIIIYRALIFPASTLVLFLSS